MLIRASITNNTTTTSSSSWSTAHRVSRRIGEVTGLDVSTAESLQVRL